METVKTIKEVRQKVREWRADGLTIGLVPTMGFLHEGHRSLIERAAAENDRVIVSDFVNPTQFGAGEDLESYPRDIERDQSVCLAAGADLVLELPYIYACNAGTEFARGGTAVLDSIGVVTALNPIIGYKNSTKIAKEALATGRGVYDLVLEHGILSKEELDTILKPENMIRPVKLNIKPRK